MTLNICISIYLLIKSSTRQRQCNVFTCAPSDEWGYFVYSRVVGVIRAILVTANNKATCTPGADWTVGKSVIYRIKFPPKKKKNEKKMKKKKRKKKEIKEKT